VLKDESRIDKAVFCTTFGEELASIRGSISEDIFEEFSLIVRITKGYAWQTLTTDALTGPVLLFNIASPFKRGSIVFQSSIQVELATNRGDLRGKNHCVCQVFTLFGSFGGVCPFFPKSLQYSVGYITAIHSLY